MTEPVIRLFASSPADVSAERQRVAMAVERLNGEFTGRVRIEPILWEEHFYSSHAGSQDQIARAAECDIVITIFGGRLGTRLPDSFPRHPRTGEPYPSGTAYEVLTAIEARQAGHDLPGIYVFRNPRSPAIPFDSPDRAEAEAQWRALQGFFGNWFRGEGGSFIAAFHEFASADDFAVQAEQCLRAFLARRGFLTTGPVRAAFAILDRMANSDTGNAGWQRDLPLSYSRTGIALLRDNRPGDAGEALVLGRRIVAQLLERFHDNPQSKQDLAWSDKAIAGLSRQAYQSPIQK